jgi:serine-type D-Ala-D-Ala carboxypeptidase (penicillin-binding protein 5/6)
MRLLAGLFAALTAALSVLAPVGALAQQEGSGESNRAPAWVRNAPRPPPVESASWMLWDDTNGVVLAADEPDVERRMASTTKLMTALVVAERADMDEIVEVPADYIPIGGQMIGVGRDERWTVEEMLTGLMVKSGNDLADLLAIHVAGSVNRFVALMNRKADRLGLENTHFVNPSGLDAEGHHSSAEDLVDIGRAVMDHPELARMMRLKSAVLPGSPLRVVTGTNKLLSQVPGAFGLKTGDTPAAGLVLVAGAERNGRRLYTVVMGSADHFADAATLLEYGFDAFDPPWRRGAAENRGSAPTTVATTVPSATTTTPTDTPPPPPVPKALPTLLDSLGWLGRLFGDD